MKSLLCGLFVSAIAVAVGVGMYLAQRNDQAADRSIDNLPSYHGEAPNRRATESESLPVGLPQDKGVTGVALRGDESGGAKDTVEALMALYDLTGDLRYLRDAQRKYGNDPRFLIVEALASENPNAETLGRLELADPDNALPNILRAGVYAKQKNWAEVVEQLEMAASKNVLTLDGRERKAAILDLLIADPTLPIGESIRPKTDQNFYNLIEAISDQLATNPGAFGGPKAAASLGISLAQRMRTMGGEHDFWNGMFANTMEFGVLLSLEGHDAFDESGMTVEQRVDQLNSLGPENRKLASAYSTLQTADLNTRRQFFARMRADGEVAALQWLALKPTNTAKR